jgi:hypothetical protein
MNQTILVVVLGAVVALLLVACGILLALYFKKQAPAANPTLSLTSNAPSVAVKGASANHEYILSAREELKKIENLLTPRLTLELTSLIPGLRQSLAERLEQANEQNFFEVFSYAISFAKAGDVRTEIERRCGLVTEMILDVYEQKLLPIIFESVPDAAAFKNRYELTQDVRAQEALNGQAALKRSLSQIYSELAELGRLQERLTNYLPELQRLRNAGTNWGSFARSFAGGAIGAVHPLIGIPLVIANWFGDKEKQQREDAFVHTAMNEFTDYLGRWEKLYNLWLPVCEEQRVYIEEKMRRIFEASVPRILTDLDVADLSLKRVPEAYSRLLQDIQSDLEDISAN